MHPHDARIIFLFFVVLELVPILRLIVRLVRNLETANLLVLRILEVIQLIGFDTREVRQAFSGRLWKVNGQDW